MIDELEKQLLDFGSFNILLDDSDTEASRRDFKNYQFQTGVEIDILVKMLHAVGCHDENIIKSIVSIAPRLYNRGLTNKNRWACFLGQCAHESASFLIMEENLNYSEKRLAEVWPNRFKSKSLRKQCAHNPERLGNIVYGGRMGNSMSEGYTYRGRGPIALTGKDNYMKAGEWLGLDILTDPGLVAADIRVGLMTSMWFFATKTYKGTPLLELCDALDHKSITKCINGGLNGYGHRVFLTGEALIDYSNPTEVFDIRIAGKGNKGPHIKEIQDMLSFLKYNPGKIDGAYGQKTRTAICEFQRDCDLPETGVLTRVGYGELLTRYSNAVVDFAC